MENIETQGNQTEANHQYTGQLNVRISGKIDDEPEAPTTGIEITPDDCLSYIELTDTEKDILHTLVSKHLRDRDLKIILLEKLSKKIRFETGRKPLPDGKQH